MELIEVIFIYINVPGYGAGGRLGIGGTDTVLTPTLIDTLQTVFIKKVYTNN
jgi:E3 ubiquitin-protein ligase HERC2